MHDIKQGQIYRYHAISKPDVGKEPYLYVKVIEIRPEYNDVLCVVLQSPIQLQWKKDRIEGFSIITNPNAWDYVDERKAKHVIDELCNILGHDL